MKFTVQDEEIEAYADELTPEEQELVRQIGVASNKYTARKNYDNEIRRATKAVLNSQITMNDLTLSVGEKLAIKTISEAMKRPSTGKLLDLMKATGEYTEKTEVKVDNMAEIIKTLKGESEF